MEPQNVKISSLKPRVNERFSDDGKGKDRIPKIANVDLVTENSA